MRVIHVSDSITSWKKAADLIKELKPSVVAIQAPSRFQDLVDALFSNSITYDLFLDELSKRTGSGDPENDERLAWVHVVRACDLVAAKPHLIEPDIDEILKKVESRLTLKNKEEVLHEARLWYLSKTGFPRKLMRYLFLIFSIFPHIIRLWLVKIFFSIYSLIVNIIPGDQHDVIAAISFADEELAIEMAKRLRELEPEVLVVHEWYADDVLRKYAEL